MKNDNYINGGSSESGSQTRGPNGSGYSKQSSFNLNQGSSVSAITGTTVSTNQFANTNVGGNTGTSWSLNGANKGTSWAGAYVEEPEYLTQGFTSGAESS